MKTSVLNKTVLQKHVLTLALTFFFFSSFSQTGPGTGSPLLTDGLSFQNYSLISGINLQPGSVYLFEDVALDVDATVRVDSFVNGATINMLDDNTNGTGYKKAFQPAIKSGNTIGYSYVVFTFRFFRANTNESILLQTVNATALDIDGNSVLKEFGELSLGGGSATYMSTTTDISLVQLGNKFKGENILGIERSGIDTTSYANMYTVSNTGINGFSVRYGTLTTVPVASVRQYSLYMKGFQYPFPTTLPLELTSFTATLNKDQVDLKWITMNEQNVSHFKVEKSYDGRNYNEAGLVFAYGNTTEKKSYSISDQLNNIPNGILYYRLRSYDVDGKTQLSELRIIRTGSRKGSVSILTYPNPVSNELRVTFPSDWQNKPVRLEVYNGNGQILRAKSTQAASQTELLDLVGLPRGFYIVKAIGVSATAHQSIIKN